MRLLKSPVARVLIAGVAMVAWLVVAQMWFFDGSFSSGLTWGLFCAGSYAALMLVGLYRARRKGSIPVRDGPGPKP